MWQFSRNCSKLLASRRSVATVSSEGFVSENLKPVISVPVAVQQKALKRQEKLRRNAWRREDGGARAGNKSIPVIQCKRQELNHYANQTYSKFKKLPLASEHWQSRKTNGDFFVFRNFAGANHRTDVTDKDFSGYQLDPRLIDNLARCGYKKPTLIQHKSIPEILEGKSCLVCSETGNGKTIAFLVPAIQQALNVKSSMPAASRKYNCPLVVIVAPGRELATQIYNVAKDLTQALPVSVRLEHGSFIQTKVEQGNRNEVDILIGSFGGLDKMFQAKYFLRNHVHHVIFDEADTLLDDTFNITSVPFLAQFSMSTVPTQTGMAQLTFVGATHPTSLDSVLGDVCSSEELTKVTTQRLHLVLPHVYQKFIRVPAVGKEKILLDIVSEEESRKRPTLIFSNKSATAHFVSWFLSQNGIKCASYHSGVELGQRRNELDKFLLGQVNVVSCTDLASRGIDTFNVRHVVNYDFPLNMSDYVHRVGRVGRVSSPQGCKVTNLVGGKLQIHLVQMIEESVRTQTQIPNVNNNIIRIIEHRRRKEEGMENSADDDGLSP